MQHKASDAPDLRGLVVVPETYDLGVAKFDDRSAKGRFTLPAAVSAGVKALCRREGVTPFMVLLAAYQAVLSRWSGQCDIVVAVGA